MSKLIEILNFEEGYKEKPYIDSRGYPTVAGGILIGPKGASLSNYTFTVPREVGDVWKQSIIRQKTSEIKNYPDILSALKQCNDARTDIIMSMAYQMGVAGLAGFKNTLKMISTGDFKGAANGMMNSAWAKQTPNRAKRHAQVMSDGTYKAYEGLI
ncbi:lysozyme [Klebsiella phage vB_KpnS-Carvaje]|uniref:Lysozyme n=1 Tax=Klebsiella phage vB_KpnS-Carvaje TaxID=2900314 RepID=A0AAE8Z3M9_9CAUD|nr:baseplate hub subunit and tail lysozyme [Klebsiella phage vB_KpnS-Carvaje]UJQ44022.1 lysozyme [Klebsiella phage vB_KpnS-Carvaje]